MVRIINKKYIGKQQQRSPVVTVFKMWFSAVSSVLSTEIFVCTVFVCTVCYGCCVVHRINNKYIGKQQQQGLADTAFKM